jgi:hypothetical protein
VSIQDITPPLKPKRKPPAVEDGPGSGFKRTKRWVDYTFGYGDIAPVVPGTGMPGAVVPPGTVVDGIPLNIGDPRDFDKNFPVKRPDVPELADAGVTPEVYDNSVLGGFLRFADRWFPDDLGGMMRGESGWLQNVPGYQQTLGKVVGAPLAVGAGAIDALNWGADQMNHLGAALVSWLPGGIQTLDWEQSQDVSFGQAFVSSMGATAGRLERGEGQAGDWLMLPFSLISLGAAQIDTENVAQDADFNVLNKKQMQEAFGSGAGMWASGGLDAAWLVVSDPGIVLGGTSTYVRIGGKATRFGGLTNQALRKVEQVDDIALKLDADGLLIAELGVEGARSSGRLSPSGEHLIEAMENFGSANRTHIWATGENAGRASTILKFMDDMDVNNPQKSAHLAAALMGHAPSWRKLREVWGDTDLYDRLSLSNGVDNLIPVRTVAEETAARANGGIYPITAAEIRYGDELFEQAEDALSQTQKIDEKFLNFEKEFGTDLDYATDVARVADEGVSPGLAGVTPEDEFAGQLISRGGARVGRRMVRAANAWRAGKARTQFATFQRPTDSVGEVSGRGHFVYDFIEKTSGSRPLTVIRWVGQGTPNGIVFMKGDRGERGVREISNWLRKSPLDPDTSALFLNRFIAEQDIAKKVLILREMEQAAVNVIARKNGIPPENAQKVYSGYAAKRQAVLDNARKTKTKFYRDPDTGEGVKLPGFYSEIDQAVAMLDTKYFAKVVGRNKFSLGMTDVTAALDVINSAWKVSVLLRLGYTQRNVVEGLMRSMAVVGFAAQHPKLLLTTPYNIPHYIGMKRGLRSARKIEAELNLSRANLAAARKVLEEGRTKKGKPKRGREEALSTAEKAEADELQRIDQLAAQLEDALRIVREKNAKRKRIGVGPNEVAPGVYLAGAFDGTMGDLARINSSADQTTRRAIQTAAQRRIDDFADSPDFKLIDPSKLSTADDFDNYFAYYTNLINRRYMADPFVSQVIAEVPIDRILAWFKTPEGRSYFQQMQATGGATQTWQDVNAYVSAMIKRIDYEVPPNSRIRELAVEGKTLTQGDVVAAMRGEELPIIAGRLVDDAGGTLASQAKKGVKLFVNEVMEWLGTIPETNLVRHPFYDAVYRSRQAELYALAAGQGQNVGSAAVKAKINRSAHADALRATNDTMYTIQELSNAAVMLRFISPFFPAWENALRTWGRIAYTSPAVIGVGNILWNIPNNLGWVVDENGNQVENSNFMRPEQNFIIWPEPIANILRKDFGPFTPGEAMATRQGSLNVVFPGGDWWFPGVGALTQVPVALALRGKPEDQEIIKQAVGEDVYRQIVPNGDPNSDLVNAMLPGILRRVKLMWGDESSDGAYLRLKNTMIQDAYITAQLENRALTEADFRQLEKKVNQFWVFQIRSAATDFSSAHSYLSPYKLQRDEWRKLAENQSLSYQQKIDMFLEKFGGQEAFLAVTRSTSETETRLQPNLKTWKRITENKDFVDRLYNIDPKLVGMFGNMGSWTDPFSYAVYGEFAGTTIGGKPIRERLTPRELVGRNEIADGWRQWGIVKDAAEERAIQLGLSSLQVKGAQFLRDILDEAEAELKAKYPAWATEKEAYNAEWPKFIQGARLMVENADLLNEDPTVYALFQYLQVREAIVEKLKSVDNNDARKAIKELGYAAAFQLRQTDIGFADFYDQYLSSDDFRDI